MIERIVAGLIRDEVEGIRRRASGLMLAIAAFILFLTAAIFLLVAIYFWLSLSMPPWQAALAMSGWVLALALILLLAGRAMMRGRRNRSETVRAGIKAFMGQLSGEDGKHGKERTLGLIAAAVVAGLVIGRRLAK